MMFLVVLLFGVRCQKHHFMLLLLLAFASIDFVYVHNIFMYKLVQDRKTEE